MQRRKLDSLIEGLVEGRCCRCVSEMVDKEVNEKTPG